MRIRRGGSMEKSRFRESFLTKLKISLKKYFNRINAFDYDAEKNLYANFRYIYYNMLKK